MLQKVHHAIRERNIVLHIQMLLIVGLIRMMIVIIAQVVTISIVVKNVQNIIIDII